MFANSISLRFNSSQYPKVLFVPETEECSITLTSIKELCTKSLAKGFPHVLAIVKDESNTKSLFDGKGLHDFLVPGEYWKWKNPNTKMPITRIYYFVINKLEEGYQLVKKIKTDKDINAQTYEDFWHCNNIVFATDRKNPYAFHSLSALIQKSTDSQEKNRWRELVIKSIAKHYGEGLSIFLRYHVFKNETVNFLKLFLFHTFDYSIFDTLYINSEAHRFILANGAALAKGEKLEDLKLLIIKQLESIQGTPSSQFAKILFEVGTAGMYRTQPLEDLIANTLPPLAVHNLAQASLWIYSDGYKEQFISLASKFPKWDLGQADLECQNMRTAIAQKATINSTPIQTLATSTHNPLVLEIFEELYAEFGLRSNFDWKSRSDFNMKILNISRVIEESSTEFAISSYSVDPELALNLLENNFKLFDTFRCLLFLSIYQRKYGIEKKNKEIYNRGVANGSQVFLNSGKHTVLSFGLGEHLLAEFTPYPSTSEQIKRGIETLEHSIALGGNHIPAKKLLAEYQIRKGTHTQAHKAHEQIEELLKQFPQDSSLHCASIRFALRFAKKEANLTAIEAKVDALSEFQVTPLISLIKALWISHPLRRDNQPDWFILASVHLKKAFENADGSHIQFLLDNLDRFDKLDQGQQTKCKLQIADLLGYSN